jgi:bacillithiol biosynthesis cysteine-adding enzyme BshC
MSEVKTIPIVDLHYSKLYRDFVGKSPRIKRYLFADNPERVASKIGSPRVNRDLVCDILEKQNSDFGSKPKSFSQIEKLRSAGAVCMFAGQQAGLFGGPLLTILKALDLVKRAALLESELGLPVVPIFWIACDDHDFEEINHTYYIDASGRPQKIVYNAEEPLSVPVAEIRFDDNDGYQKLNDAAAAAFGGTDFSKELLGRLMRAYSPNASFVSAFGRYMADIIPDIGMVFFCPHNKEIKILSRWFFKQIIERHFMLKSKLEETQNNLKNDNYHIQVEKKESAAHLFYHFPARMPVHLRDDYFITGEKNLSLTAILDLIDKCPERFSPDVLTRPIWQSYLFPVVAQIGGPAEIAYFCQIGELFELFGLMQPFYYARASATIIEKRHEDLLNRLKIDPVDLSGDVEKVLNSVIARSFPARLEDEIKRFYDGFRDDYDNFVKFLLEYEKNLEPTARQTFGKIDFALKNLEKKIFSEYKKRMDSTRQQVYKLASAFYPNGNLQERSLNINYFISKYGFNVVNYLYSVVDVTKTDHQLIFLSGMLS